MYVELHLLQNFAPNCLNRDDTNSPKDCVFGGFRRARISSQCLKRAIRVHDSFRQCLDTSEPAVRTRRLIRAVAAEIEGKTVSEAPSDKTAELVAEIFEAGGLERTKPKKGQPETWLTNIQVFMPRPLIMELVAAVQEADREAIPSKDKTETKKMRSELVGKLGEMLAKRVQVPELAMFGRMVAIDAGKPLGRFNLNIDAASQVAHAISTNSVAMEMDYFTAVDDLKDRSAEGEDAGAGMLGTVEFNSACYYRYANVHVPQLVKNLGGDAELARKTVAAFLKASVLAIPTGKQNSFAAHNPPSLVFAVVRRDGPWSLTNAFVRPVEPHYEQRGRSDLVGLSVRRLDHHWNKLCAAYGGDGIQSKAVLLLHDSLTDDEESTAADQDIPLTHLRDNVVDSLQQLIETTLQAVDFEAAKGGAA